MKQENRRVNKPQDKKIYEDTEKVLIKIWDHVNLAQTQYSGLKQTDEEYRKKFDNSIEPIQGKPCKRHECTAPYDGEHFYGISFLGIWWDKFSWKYFFQP